MVKPINLMQSIIPIWSKPDLTKAMTFIVQTANFPYELSFILLRQGQITDL